MKTVYDSKTSNKFDPMFLQATEFLKANKDNTVLTPVRQQAIENLTAITSVQEYFSFLADLWALREQGGERFIMLPFNEPEFVIDADKREIIVPADFKKNGVSVQNDEIAESLIFKIDRFFDYADLGDRDMHIQVLWQRNDGVKNITNIDIVDRHDANFIRFMWPLRSEITAIPGVIKFAVRFYRTTAQDTTDVVYVFNTKIASATISPGHQFDVSEWTIEQGERASDNFTYAIVNSKMQGNDNPHIPSFLLTLAMHSDYGISNNEQENFDLPEIVTSETPEVQAFLTEDAPAQILRVTALAEDAGYISYVWKFKDQISNTTHLLLGEDEYLPSADQPDLGVHEPTPYKKYYINTTGEPEGPFEAAPWEEVSGRIYYERYSRVNFNRELTDASGHPIEHFVGLVTVDAQNTVGTTTSDPATNTKSLKFPGPVKPVITTDLNAEDELDNNGFGTFAIAIEEEPFTTYTYKWLKGDSRSGAFTEITNLTGLAPNEGALEITNVPGYYKVQVQAARNFYTADEFISESTVARITRPIQAPEIESPQFDVPMSTQYEPAVLTIVLRPFANNESALVSDKVTYQWFKYQLNENNEVRPVAIADAAGEWDGESNITYTVDRHTEGGYFCRIFNELGGKTRYVDSKDFSVTMYTPAGNTTPDPEENIEG